jgi:glycosyltransferase involved in cell wall biosynthesis
MLNTIYISYDGMTDPLGQSQVLPYLNKISKDYRIHLISCEKPDNYNRYKKDICEIINGANIVWYPLMYHKSPPILSTLWDLWRIKVLSIKIHKKNKVKLLHCRSHLTGIIGESLKKSFGIPYIFDMRSFYPDERVDGDLWPQEKFLYRLIFKYFKKKEKDLFTSSDKIIVLTNTAKDILNKDFKKNDVEVIPCCADFEHFNFNKIKKEEISSVKESLGIKQNQFVLSYLGSLGTWYLLEEMLLFFKELKEVFDDPVFLFITPTNPEIILSSVKKLGLSSDDFRIHYIERPALPKYLMVSSASVFFIKNTYSKKASSPTKHAELMGLGIPVIANEGVGDVGDIIKNSKTGTLVNLNDTKTYRRAVESISLLLEIDRGLIRDKGEEIFSLEKGSAKYTAIYNNIIKNL